MRRGETVAQLSARVRKLAIERQFAGDEQSESDITRRIIRSLSGDYKLIKDSIKTNTPLDAEKIKGLEEDMIEREIELKESIEFDESMPVYPASASLAAAPIEIKDRCVYHTGPSVTHTTAECTVCYAQQKEAKEKGTAWKVIPFDLWTKSHPKGGKRASASKSTASNEDEKIAIREQIKELSNKLANMSYPVSILKTNTHEYSIDSCATPHQSPYVDDFVDLENKNGIVQLADGSQIPSVGEGILQIKFTPSSQKTKLDKSIFVPNLSSGLISLPQLSKDPNYKVVFENENCEITDKSTQEITNIPLNNKGLFTFAQAKSSTSMEHIEEITPPTSHKVDIPDEITCLQVGEQPTSIPGVLVGPPAVPGNESFTNRIPKSNKSNGRCMRYNMATHDMQ